MGLFEKKALLKPKAMEAFIKNKIESLPKPEGFLLVKIELDGVMADRHGNSGCKKILAAISERIAGLSEHGNYFCQSSDGGFLIFEDGNFSEAELYEKGWHIITEICQPVAAGKEALNPEINLGLAVYPDSGKTYEALTASLSIAALVAKREGINTFSVYIPKISAEKSKEYAQLAELREGVNRNQFLLYYQPIVDLATGEAHGAEALLRWRHPILGIVSPKDFFDVIEASGEIYQLGLWMFEQMLAQSRQWRADFPDKKPVYHINLSAKQMIHPELSEDIKRVVRKFPDFDPREVCFEVSAFTAALKDETILGNILALYKAGFRLAIDNFGDADVPVSALLSLPAEMIKMSGSCFKGSPGAVMARDAARLLAAQNANEIKLVAEGIESREMATRAKSFGIRLMQGYHYFRPAPAEEYGCAITDVPWKESE